MNTNHFAWRVALFSIVVTLGTRSVCAYSDGIVASNELVVEPATVDLGHISRYTIPQVCQFTVRNLGTKTINDIHHKASCSCQSVTLSSISIAPGDSIGLTVTIDPSRQKGSFEHAVSLFAADPSVSTAAMITGEVYTPFDLSPKSIVCDDSDLAGSAQTVDVTIHRLEVANITILSASSENSYVACAFAESPDDKDNLVVSISPQWERLAPGRWEDTVYVTILLGEREEDIAIPVRLRKSGPLRLEPESLSFGYVRRNSGISRLSAEIIVVAEGGSFSPRITQAPELLPVKFSLKKQEHRRFVLECALDSSQMAGLGGFLRDSFVITDGENDYSLTVQAFLDKAPLHSEATHPPTPSINTQAEGDYEVIPPVLDFGNVSAGTLITKTVKVRSLSSHSGFVFGPLKSSCSCLSATGEKEIHSPANEITVFVSLDPDRITGPFEKNIYLPLKVGGSLLPIPVRGNVDPSSYAIPPVVNFSAVTLGETAQAYILLAPEISRLKPTIASARLTFKVDGAMALDTGKISKPARFTELIRENSFVPCLITLDSTGLDEPVFKSELQFSRPGRRPITVPVQAFVDPNAFISVMPSNISLAASPDGGWVGNCRLLLPDAADDIRFLGISDECESFAQILESRIDPIRRDVTIRLHIDESSAGERKISFTLERGGRHIQVSGGLHFPNYSESLRSKGTQ